MEKLVGRVVVGEGGKIAGSQFAPPFVSKDVVLTNCGAKFESKIIKANYWRDITELLQRELEHLQIGVI